MSTLEIAHCAKWEVARTERERGQKCRVQAKKSGNKTSEIKKKLHREIKGEKHAVKERRQNGPKESGQWERNAHCDYHSWKLLPGPRVVLSSFIYFLLFFFSLYCPYSLLSFTSLSRLLTLLPSTCELYTQGYLIYYFYPTAIYIYEANSIEYKKKQFFLLFLYLRVERNMLTQRLYAIINRWQWLYYRGVIIVKPLNFR